TVEIRADNVGQLSDAARVRNRNVEAADRSAAAHAGKRVRQSAARTMVVEAERQIVAWSIPASTAAPARGSGSERVIQTYVQIVAVAVGGGDVMEILITARQIWQWNVLQQSLRSSVDLRNRVVSVFGVRPGNKNPYWLSRFRPGSICGLRKIPLPLQRGWHGRKLIERIFSALAVVVDEIERLASAMVDVRDIQRSATDPPKLFCRYAGFSVGCPVSEYG